jgi:hypothetical protein
VVWACVALPAVGAFRHFEHAVAHGDGAAWHRNGLRTVILQEGKSRRIPLIIFGWHQHLETLDDDCDVEFAVVADHEEGEPETGEAERKEELCS